MCPENLFLQPSFYGNAARLFDKVQKTLVVAQKKPQQLR
jgi:hypothetical protein